MANPVTELIVYVNSALNKIEERDDDEEAKRFVSLAETLVGPTGALQGDNNAKQLVGHISRLVARLN